MITIAGVPRRRERPRTAVTCANSEISDYCGNDHLIPPGYCAPMLHSFGAKPNRAQLVEAPLNRRTNANPSMRQLRRFLPGIAQIVPGLRL